MFNRSGQSAGKTSSNPIGKIPIDTGCYLSGFADGEGSFNLSVIKRKDYKKGWKVGLSFNISQKDETMPFLFKKVLCCGKIRYRKDGICYYEVRDIQEIVENVIPFFRSFPLKGEKQRKNFEIFCQMSEIVRKKRHLRREGMKTLLKLRGKMKVGRSRKYTEEEILQKY